MKKSKFILFISMVSVLAFLLYGSVSWANMFGGTSEEGAEAGTVELNGDILEYLADGNIVIAEGNVEINHKGTQLTCDRVEFSRDDKVAHAQGNVRLNMNNGQISGEELTFNFETMTGQFKNARIASDPYYGEGLKVAKVDENQVVMQEGYVTTCDLDKPHYQLFSRKLEVYPGEKIVARNIRMKVGSLPLLYIPRFTQRIDDKKPRVLFTPGFDKEWGLFLLSQWRYSINENLKGTVHLDYRERLDLAEGVDLDYKTEDFGAGVIKTYYTNERRISSKHLFQEQPTPTVERERFKAEWRHKWDIDPNTSTIMQYYKISDSTFLKDFFENESDEDINPDSFFLLTHTLPGGTFSFRTDVRVNRFESKVERLPELKLDFSNAELGSSGFFLKSSNTYSNLTKKSASPSEVRQNTMRFDFDNELSHPLKLGIIEFNPFIGGRNTYYTKTNDPEKYNSVRGIFKTGATLSTKFYRIFDVYSEEWGLDINRIRHIITPSVNYRYESEPTLASSQLDSFDGIDSLQKDHKINFSLENKLQTKRNGNTVELLRLVVGTDFRLKDDPNAGGFDNIKSDIDFRPTDWLTLYADADYDTRMDRLDTFNFDTYINGGDKWSFSFGKRFDRNNDDQITGEVKYRLNPKWAVSVYDRFDTASGTQKELNLTVKRDLHAWELDINFREQRGEGSEILLIFTLKAFPELGLDFGTSFNKRKPGSQSGQ